ncbi:MAG TPA: ribonuclease Z [Flavobacterium sp.]|jgi:hypothetical protein
MRVEEKGHTTIIKDTQGDSTAFLAKVTNEYKSFENRNLILDVSSNTDITMENLIGFEPLSKKHKKNKKSFVLVAPDSDFNSIPASIIVVPSLLEAHDIIEMDEIERDLGF